MWDAKVAGYIAKVYRYKKENGGKWKIKTEHVSYDEFKNGYSHRHYLRSRACGGADKLLRCQIDFGMKMPDGGTMEPEQIYAR